MKHIPEWMIPGGGFQRLAREWRAQIDHITELPWVEMMDKYVGFWYMPQVAGHYVHTVLDLGQRYGSRVFLYAAIG